MATRDEVPHHILVASEGSMPRGLPITWGSSPTGRLTSLQRVPHHHGDPRVPRPQASREARNLHRGIRAFKLLSAVSSAKENCGPN